MVVAPNQALGSLQLGMEPGFLATLAATAVVLAVTLYTVYYVVSHRYDRVMLWLTACLVTALWWTSTQALKLMASTEASTVAMLQVQHVAVAAAPVVWLGFALVYTDHADHLDRRTVTLMSLPCAAVLLLAWTNFRYHDLVWPDYSYVELGGVTTIQPEFGVALTAYIVYGYLLTLAGVYYFLQMTLSSEGVYRGQAVAIVLAVVTPLAMNFLYLTGLAFEQDPTAIGFSASVLFLSAAIYRYRFLDVLPVARDSVVEEMKDPYVVLDDDGRMIDVNPAAAATLDTEEPVGEQLEAVHPELHEAVESGGEPEIEIGGRHYTASSSPIRTRGTNAKGTVVLLRDVTERKRRERELERANERLERFASVVSHDLRNPLNVAYGYLDLARDQRDSEELRKVADAHRRMDDMIQDVLAMARHSDVEQEEVSLEDAARRAWSTVDTEDAELRVEASGEVYADPEKLRRALENLYRNSVEHSGRDVTVTVEQTEDGFHVQDTGPGFSEPPEVFDEESGFQGLGLWIVHDIARVHGWEVHAENHDGARVVFEI